MTEQERLDYLFRLLNALSFSTYDVEPILQEISKILGVVVTRKEN